MSRKDRKQARREARRGTGVAQATPKPSPKPTLADIRPITINQSKVFRKWFEGSNLLIHGYAGTGKSFMALWLALNEVEEFSQFREIVLIRSAVPSRTQGFLPGTEEEKAAVYEAPYRDIVDELYGRSGHYNRLKETKVIDFETTSFLRGRTFKNAIVLIDEVQNLTDGEINTAMTRVGENCRVILMGDFRQNDLENKRNEQSCIRSLMETISRMDSFDTVELGIDDIVRSGLCKEWIIAREFNADA